MKSTLKFMVQGLVIVLVALVLGLGSAFATLYVRSQGPWGNISNGPWRTSLQIGSTQAGMYSRAVVALFGTFALDQSEVIYYIAFEDSNGEALDSKCNYRVEGGEFDTHWWSLTVYKDFFFIPNDVSRYSYSSTTMARGPDGKWTVKLSAEPEQGNWLPTGHEQGRLNLNLRLYNPGQSVRDNLGGIDLPRIVKGDCP